MRRNKDAAEDRCGHLGVLVRYADDSVVMGATRKPVEDAARRVGILLQRLKLAPHPEKMGQVDLSQGRQGFDFLGGHLSKRPSGPIWEKEGRRAYFLQRCPNQGSMKRIRQRVKEPTGRTRNGVKDIRGIIRDLNPVLRGWGNYFKSGNAAKKANQGGTYLRGRLRRFLVKRQGRNLQAGIRTMPQPERPAVSRVRVNPAHGLNGSSFIHPCLYWPGER